MILFLSPSPLNASATDLYVKHFSLYTVSEKSYLVKGWYRNST